MGAKHFRQCVMNSRFHKSDFVARRSAGFTMVEMLVALAIALVLAGMGFAVLGKVREAQKSAVCTNNLRQLGMMIHLYMGENGRKFPKGPDNSYVKWVRVLKAHAGLSDADNSLFCCPADSVPRSAPGPLRSYAVNNYLAPAAQGNRVVEPPYPSQFVMLSERVRPFSIVGRDESNDIWNINDITPLHHNETCANTLFLDGHVAMLQVQPPENKFQQKHINPF